MQARLPIVARDNRSAPSPPSYAQQRLWFLDQLNPANPFYNIHHSLNLDFALDVRVLERALNEIVRRHEALRTPFVAVEGRPMQVVAPELRLKLPVVDLGHLPAPRSRRRRPCELATEEAREPFDLGTGPLLRVLVVRLTPRRWVLSLTLHHIVSDGWSLRILFGELSRLYEAFAAGRPSPCPSSHIQYADFALWQREQLAGDRLRSRSSPTGATARRPAPARPAHRPAAPAGAELRGATHHFSLPPDSSPACRRPRQRPARPCS